MIRLGTVLAQDSQGQSDFWGKLLGIDRVKIPPGAEYRVDWHNMPEAWILFLVIIPAILLLFGLLYRKERRDVGTGPKVVLTVIRALAVLLVLLLLMGPVLTVETIKVRRAYIVVMLDESRSMKKVDLLRTDDERRAVADVTGIESETELARLSRADIVRYVLTNPELRILEELEEKLNVAYFTFSSGASAKESREVLFAGDPADKEAWDGYRTDSCIGSETAIGDSIKAALNSLRGQYVVGVVIFSDGKNNAGMATREVARQCKQRFLPIYAVPAGIPHKARDIALSELEAVDAVLANDSLKVSFKVASEGYDGEQVNVGVWLYRISDPSLEISRKPEDLDRLIEESEPQPDHPVTLKGNSKKRLESFVVEPTEPGDYMLILRVAPRVDENTSNNNYLTHQLRVADDKIKVLYVEHPPRYEYRFLKNALIRDPKILAHCFLTSADEGFPQEHTRADEPLFRQPLKEFPTDLKSLLEFDVIIYGDVEPGRLGPQASANIEKFVSEFGGGIIFISGTMANPRSLINTPLGNLLPVVADETRDLYEHEKVWDQTLGYQLTPNGKSHPITNFKEFSGDLDRNMEHWEDRVGRDGLVGIRWFQPVRKLKPGASPLVELTGVRGEAARPPLFVTQHVGRGRVFWSATDETWLWRYLVGDYPWFYPFWQRAMYWVRQGKLLGARRFRVNVDKERYSRGEPVQIFVNAYDERFEFRTDPSIEVFIDPPAGSAPLERIKVTLLKGKTRDGYYEGQYRPGATGPYRVWAGGEDEASRASAKFSVFIPDREDDEPIIDVRTLKDLAGESDHGHFVPLQKVAELNEKIQRSENQLRETREDELWDSPLVYLIFALLLTTEWILRKIFRMQ